MQQWVQVLYGLYYNREEWGVVLALQDVARNIILKKLLSDVKTKYTGNLEKLCYYHKEMDKTMMANVDKQPNHIQIIP